MEIDMEIFISKMVNVECLVLQFRFTIHTRIYNIHGAMVHPQFHILHSTNFISN